jgi:putative hemolysin
MKNSEKVAFGTVGIIKTIAILTSPFVKFLTFSTNFIAQINKNTQNLP